MPNELHADALEKIAEKVHETWMAARLKEGWVLGTERNDVKKTTPCLVPYCELPESEKEYDRITARTVINALNECGFEIIKK